MTVQGDSGGIFFRSGYRFRIGNDGNYDLVTGTQQIATGTSAAIQTGYNTSNHVTIVAVGSNITIAINAQTVIDLNDSSYTSGSVGLMAVDLSIPTSVSCYFNIYTA